MPRKLGEARIMHKGFHLRCCKGPVSSSQGAATLNISKKIKATFFLLFYYLSTKIESMAMLPATFYKSFYLSAMVANIFGYPYGTLFRNARSPPDFYQATVFLKVYLFFGIFM